MYGNQTGTFKVLLSPQTVTDGATAAGHIDAKDAKAVEIIVNYAAEETTHAANSTLLVRHGDGTDESHFSTIDANSSISLDLVNAKGVVLMIPKTASVKRYVGIHHTSGTVTGGNILLGAVGRTFGREEGPASTTDMQISTNDTIRIIPSA